MTTYPDPDASLNTFIGALAEAAARAGWRLIRHSRGHSDRGFELSTEGRCVVFTTKISQTPKGFWGLTSEKAQDISRGSEQLILLNDSESGYFISTVVFGRLLGKFSRTQEGAVRINENVVRKETRFDGADDAFEMLRERAGSRTGEESPP